MEGFELDLEILDDYLYPVYNLWNIPAGLGPVLLVRHNAVARIFANGSAAFIENCAANGWNSCDSIKPL